MQFFTAASNRKTLVSNDYFLQQAFNMLDQDGDGYITNKEFKKRYGFENETPSEMKGSKIHSGIWDDIDKLFMRIDETGQSRINFDTFRSHMLELIEKGCY